MNGKTDERMCLLDESKVCDNCGECDRCDLDPNKICDNCCKCLALEDDESEFRTVTIDGQNGSIIYNKNGEIAGARFPAAEKRMAGQSGAVHAGAVDNGGCSVEEPSELTPELIAYWESRLAEYGEAPIDDGLGEIRVSSRIPVSGVRRSKGPHRRGIRTNE